MTEISISYANIAVVGGGAWGTALAMISAHAGRPVSVWAREPDVVDSINRHHENARFLGGVALSSSIAASGDIRALARAEAVLVTVPAQHLRASLEMMRPVHDPKVPLVLCAKGIEKASGKLTTEILRDVLPAAECAILSGPSFAADVARGLPTAVTIAGRPDTVARLQATLSTPTFRPYGSEDIVGVALGGAAKNVYAIACGIADGLGLGESARAALLSRGFAELARLGEALGGQHRTFMGLSGLGDLVLTATSATSRNFALGRAVGRGTPLAQIKAPGAPLAEGFDTAPALVLRGRKVGLELPVAAATSAILAGDLVPAAAIATLMSRPLTSE